MTPLKCELCGSTDFVKEEDFFVCQHCKTKYTKEEAQKIMGTVTINHDIEMDNLSEAARRAYSDGDSIRACNMFSKVLEKKPNDWEANWFPFVHTVMFANDSDFSERVDTLKSRFNSLCVPQVKELNDSDKELALNNIRKSFFYIIDTSRFYLLGKRNAANEARFIGADSDMINKTTRYAEKLIDFILESIKTFKTTFDKDKMAYDIGCKCPLLCSDLLAYEGKHKIIEYLKTLDSYSENDFVPKKSGGCYVATCVYGSYDCPEVWTLRRYRDDSLAKTWYGRIFIHTYYAISPTLVKWFGETKWFKEMWKPQLDIMVETLKKKGVESTPYQDIEW